MTSDIYGIQLQTIVDILERAGFAASIHGDGEARLVRAAHGARSAELSYNGVGVLVELFEQPHKGSVRDYQQDTPEFAADDALEWFSRSDRFA